MWSKIFIVMEKKITKEVERFQKLAGIKSEMELGLKPDQLEEDDYDMGTPSGDTDATGDTDAMSIAEDDFSATMDAVDRDPVT